MHNASLPNIYPMLKFYKHGFWLKSHYQQSQFSCAVLMGFAAFLCPHLYRGRYKGKEWKIRRKLHVFLCDTPFMQFTHCKIEIQSGIKVICQSTKYLIEFRLFNLGTWDGKKGGSITTKFPRTRARIPCDFIHFAFTTFTKLGSVF